MPKKKSTPADYRAALPDGSRIDRQTKRDDAGELVGYGSWYWRVYDPDRRPKRKRVNLRTKDKGAAMRKALDLARRRDLGNFDPWADPAPQGVAVTGAVVEYLDRKRADGRAASTLGADGRLLDAFVATLPAGCRADHVERRHVEAFLAAPKLDREGNAVGPKSAATRKRYLAVLGHFFAFCTERGYTRADPTEAVETPAGRAGRRDHVTEAEAEAMLRQLGTAEVLHARSYGWLRDWVVFGLGSGLRPGEQGALRWRDVRLDVRPGEGSIRVRGTKTEKSARTVPVAGDALGVLRRRFEARTGEGDGLVFSGARGGRVNDRHLSKRLQALAEAAGVPKNVTAYSLRHSYGSKMAGAGVPLLDLARIMGTSVQMIERHYGHYDPARGASHVARVFGSSAPEHEAEPSAPVR